jgi:hypothetical protein
MKIVYWVLFLILLSGLSFAEKAASFPELTNPYEFHINNDRIYICDNLIIYVYSLKDYRLIKKFGKKGEGPGEFMVVGLGNGLMLGFQPDHLLVNSYGKLVYFTRDGNYVKESKIKNIAKYLYPVSDCFVGLKYKRVDRTLYHQINLYDSAFDFVRTIYQHEHGIQFWKKLKFNPLTIAPPQCSIYDNKIFIIDGQHEAVHVFKKTGEKLFSVTVEGELRKFTGEDKNKVLNGSFWRKLSRGKKSVFDFPRYYPPVRWFYIDPVREILYLSAYKNEDEKTKFTLFDLTGRMVKKILLSSEDYNTYLTVFFKGTYSRLVDNEEEGWELHVIEIERNYK